MWYEFKLMRIAVMAAVVLAGTVSVFSQTMEHYNSPLYNPRLYDPKEDTTTGLPDALKTVGIDQKLGEPLPADTILKDENGREVRLGDYLGKRPVIVAFVYFECPMLCTQVLNGLTGSLKGISLDPGKDFDILAISFDPRDNDSPDLARNKKAAYLERYDRPGTENGWHFLTGTEDQIQKVTQAAGFHYKWDDRTDQFAHAGGIMVANTEGRLSHYFYGIDYAPKDVKFAVMEAADGKVGNTAEQLLLYCYHYDPATGKYGVAIMRVMRLGGIATVILMGIFGIVFWRRNKNKNAGPAAAN